MKPFIFFLLLLFLSVRSVSAQQQRMKVNLLLDKALNEQVDKHIIMNLVVKGNSQLIREHLLEWGGTYRSTYESYGIATMEAQYVREFAALEFVERIAYVPLEKGYLLNDTMLVNNSVTDVHSGKPFLQAPYSGNGTIIGFIDTGIDFTHPDFLDSAGDTRVLAIWDQTADTLVHARIPQPYGYGQTWNSTDINNGNCTHDDVVLSHGTNVVGIAAGNGKAVNRYKGVAPEAGIVMVASDFSKTNWLETVADGVEYIYHLADSLQRPCVVNISAGTYLGSHDGTDPAARRIDTLIKAKKGRFLTCAAGNLGTLPFHLGYTVTSDTNFTWFLNNPSINGVFFEIWADTTDFQQIHFAFGADKTNPSYNFRGRTAFDQVQNRLNTVYRDSIMNNGNRISYVETYAERVEDKYLLQVYFPAPDSNQYYFRFMTTGVGAFDCWSDKAFVTASMVASNLPNASSFPDILNYQPPDTFKTVVSSFSCLPSVLTVGNYVNRDRYLDVDSVLQLDVNLINKDISRGEMAASSCSGPTRTGLLKPDVAATGDFTITANRLASIPLHIANNQANRIGFGGMHKRNGGTSMAAPVVAGIAALYFEKCPTASYEQVKQAIITSAFSDTFAVNLPNGKWGNGKVDAFAALTTSNIQPLVNPSLINNLCEGEQVLLNGENGYDNYVWSNGDSSQSITVDSAVVLLLTVSDSSGCSGISDSVKVFVYPYPGIPDISAQDANLYTSTRAYAYQWYFEESPIVGATDSTYQATKNGFYRVEVLNEYGCGSFSDSMKVNLTLGAHESNKQLRLIALYPNPSTGKCYLRFSTVIDEVPAVQLYDILGKKHPVILRKTGADILEIAPENPVKGIFLLTLGTNQDRSAIRMTFQ